MHYHRLSLPIFSVSFLVNLPDGLEPRIAAIAKGWSFFAYAKAKSERK